MAKAVQIVFLALSFFSCNNGVFSSFEGLTSIPRGILSLIAIPRQYEYFLGDVFNRDTDLTVLGVYADGTTQNIPVKDVTIEGDLNFRIPGLKDIWVKYDKQEDRFTIIVRDPSKDPPEGDTTIEIPLPDW